MALTLLLFGLFVFLGHLLVAVFQRTRIPDVLLLIGVGVLIGPYGLKLVAPGDFGKIGPVFTTLALVILLFEGGIGLNIRAIFSSLLPCTIVAVTTSAVTLGLVTAISYPFLGNLYHALALGAILSCTSAAVVIPMAQALPLREKTRTLLILESALTDVFCIVAVFFIARMQDSGSFSPLAIARFLPMTLLLPIAIGTLGAFAWRLVITRVRKFPNTAFTEFALLFVLYGVTEMFHGNGAIAALVFGIAISNLPRALPTGLARMPVLRLNSPSPAQFGLFAEAAFLIKLWFFIYLGFSLRFSDTQDYLIGAWIVAAFFLARIPIVIGLLPRWATRADAVTVSSMVPKGLVSAVLAAAYVEAHPEATAVRNIAFAVVLLSICVTSLVIPAQGIRPFKRFSRAFFSGFDSAESPHAPARVHADHDAGKGPGAAH